MGIPRQEYWIGLSFPSPEDLPDPRIKLESPALLTSPALQADTFLTELRGKPISVIYLYITYLYYILGFPGGSHGKESACNVGDPGSIPGSRRLLACVIMEMSKSQDLQAQTEINRRK